MGNVLNKKISNKIAKKKCVVTVDIDFDKYVLLTKNEVKAHEVSKYPVVVLDYTITSNGLKYQEILDVLMLFKSKLIKKFELMGIYENKYTFRYTLGSDNKTLEQKDIQTFKDRYIYHLENNGLKLEI